MRWHLQEHFAQTGKLITLLVFSLFGVYAFLCILPSLSEMFLVYAGNILQSSLILLPIIFIIHLVIGLLLSENISTKAWQKRAFCRNIIYQNQSSSSLTLFQNAHVQLSRLLMLCIQRRITIYICCLKGRMSAPNGCNN